MKRLTSEQIFAIDAVVDMKVAEMDESSPSITRRGYLTSVKQFMRSHNPSMAMLSMIASGVPADEARAIFALVLD